MLICDGSVSLGTRRCKNLSSWNSLPENAWLSEGLFFQFFPEHRVPYFWSPPWTPFSGCRRSAACSGHDLILCRGKRQVPTSSWQSPFGVINLTFVWGHFMAIVSHGARNAHSQFCQRLPRQATHCAVTGPGLISSKSLWTIPVFLASWSRKIFPLVAFSHI